MSDFLNALADQISSQFAIGENTTNTLDAVIDGKNVKYGSLGDFAKKIDQSAERKYVEEGYLRVDPYNTLPKQFEILVQQPNATVLVKKRMFSTVSENFRPDYMDSDEKLYYRASKILFQNKCNQIANLERLSKIQKITSMIGEVDNYIIPLILSESESLKQNFSGSPAQKNYDKLLQVTDLLRRVYSYNNSSPYTSWIVDNNNLFKSKYAEGTGVIELTNFTSISTTTSIDTDGSCSIEIKDPYEVMLITEYDIEKAISDASNLFYKSKTFQLGKENTETLINEMQTRLNQYRVERNASPIIFKVNPDTLLGKRVTAIIDRSGIEIEFKYNALGSIATLGFIGGQNVGVEVAKEYLKDGSIAGFDGLDTNNKRFGNVYTGDVKEFNITNTHTGLDSELNLFCRIIKSIYDQISLLMNANNSFQTANEKTNYARRKLMFNFLGKKIVQPMDEIHVYMSSNSKFDENISSGLSTNFNAGNFLQKSVQSFIGLKNSFNTVFNPKYLDLQIEKATFVGNEFPTWLWSSMRSQFVNENEGVHVFGGIVSTADDYWSDGSFSVSINCKDNMSYFDMGKVNFKPGVDTFNGSLFDPMTPFKTSFDTITSNAKDSSPEFLEDNKFILSKSIEERSPILKYKQGRNVGLPVTEKSIFQDKIIDPNTGLPTKIFYAPDGLTYKWKEGIGVQVQFGSSTELNPPNRVGNPNIFIDPFANQDIMNVLSLLITGLPYNLATFWKAIGSRGFGNNPNSNENSANTFYESLRESLFKNNLLWGNFIPFKNLTIDEASYSRMLQGQFTLEKQNNNLNSKLEKLRDIYYKLTVSETADILNREKVSKFIDELKQQAFDLEKEVDTLIGEIRKTDQSYYTNFSDDSSYDISSDQDSNMGRNGSSERNIETKNLTRKKLRRQLNFLTRRMSYNVRANTDKNLFIVDDQYDKDYDIIAYNQELADIKLYNNEFLSVRDKIKTTAGLLNLEVFCDTQGHIRVRSPQYNRMPSSVFYKMMYMKNVSGVQIFPKFLSDLFDDQLTTLKLQIEVIEDYIRLYCSILGYNSDTDIYFFINADSTSIKNGELFVFLSNEEVGKILNIEQLIKSANPDSTNDESLKTFNLIESQAISKRDIFRTSDRAAALKEVLKTKSLAFSGYSIDETDRISQNTWTQTLAQRIFDRTSEKINIKNYFSAYYVDVFKVLSDLAAKIADRQRSVKLFYSLMKNYKEYKSLDDNSKASNKLLTLSNYGNMHIPEVFEHMIEDENYDDFGPGSGKRYIIKRSQIKTMSFSERPPTNTYVEVKGTLPFNLPLPEGLNSFPSGGNAMVTAAAIDYDMWRTYGFTNSDPIQVPFLRDPSKQCAPYAAMLLSRARKEIFSASITISGNEFMQPGEVVFLEDRGMLFYVKSVSHSFSFGSEFSTRLELIYGHVPGEYIPTMLDAVGKMLYNNRDLGDIIINRQSNVLNQKPVGVLTIDANNKLIDAVISNDNSYFKDVLDKIFNTDNLRVIDNILYSVQHYINGNENSSNKKKTRVELRIYHDENNLADPSLISFAGYIESALRGTFSLETKSYDPSKTAPVPWVAYEDAIKISIVNRDDINDPRSPSQKAISTARDLISSYNQTGESSSNEKNKANQLRKTLFKCIIDCWVVFEDNK